MLYRDAGGFQLGGERVECGRIGDFPAEIAFRVRAFEGGDRALPPVVQAESPAGVRSVHGQSAELVCGEIGPVVEVDRTDADMAECLDRHDFVPPSRAFLLSQGFGVEIGLGRWAIGSGVFGGSRGCVWGRCPMRVRAPRQLGSTVNGHISDDMLNLLGRLHTNCATVKFDAWRDCGACGLMAQGFNTSMRIAARRHHEAAEALFEGTRQDVAGYLYGLAAECGINALMIDLGMRPLGDTRASDDPFYAHFARLKTMLRDDAYARRHEDLRKFTEDDRFMAHWDVSMRYSDGKDIRKVWVEVWRQNAKDVMAEI